MARTKAPPNIKSTTVVFFIFVAVSQASLPFQQSPPPPGDSANQPDPAATFATTVYSVPLFPSTSSTVAGSATTNKTSQQQGASQTAIVPGSGLGPGNAGGNGITAESLTRSPATMTNAASAAKSGSIGTGLASSMSTSMSASQASARQTGAGSRRTPELAIFAGTSLRWWGFLGLTGWVWTLS